MTAGQANMTLRAWAFENDYPLRDVEDSADRFDLYPTFSEMISNIRARYSQGADDGQR